jgi:glycosyltransferase involved in cell wall biosynthesis
VPERDVVALANAVGWLLGHAAEGRALGAAARDRVIRDFGWERFGARLVDIYDRVSRRAGAGTDRAD